jgi:NAD(P)-dependent dehydrogenase (short-subunit alcohol dehydrogenase family)
MREFAGKVAVITGGANGIGRAFADKVAARGMKVVLADLRPEPLETAISELRAQGVEATGVMTDVSSRESLQNLAEKTLAAYGGVHLVLSNAGVPGFVDNDPIWTRRDKDWAWTLGVNLWGALYCTETFLPLLVDQKQGHFVITASATSFTYPRSSYNVSKHAVACYAELCFSQLKAMGSPVGFSLLCPGGVATNIYKHEPPPEFRNDPDPEREAAEAARLARVRRTIPQALRAPEHVAEALINGIIEDRFYIFNDHDWDELTRDRFDRILNREDPPPLAAFRAE